MMFFFVVNDVISLVMKWSFEIKLPRLFAVVVFYCLLDDNYDDSVNELINFDIPIYLYHNLLVHGPIKLVVVIHNI